MGTEAIPTRSHTMTMKNLITRNQNLPRNHTNKNMNPNLIRPLTIITKNLSMDMGRTIPINHPKIITGTITTTNRITRNMAEVITTTKNHHTEVTEPTISRMVTTERILTKETITKNQNMDTKGNTKANMKINTRMILRKNRN